MVTRTIAASNTPAAKRNGANYLCDGTNDHEQIIQALNASGSGDIVLMYEGNYNLRGEIYIKGNVTLKGEGPTKTFLDCRNRAALFTNSGGINLEDFFIEGNGYAPANTLSWTGVVNIRHPNCNIRRIHATADNSCGCVMHVVDDKEPVGTSWLIQNIEFNDCEVKDTGTYGYLHNHWDKNNPSRKVHKNIRYINCRAIRCANAYGNVGKGYPINGSQHNWWCPGFDFAEGNDIDGLLVKNCRAEWNLESGFHMEFDPRKENIKFEDCVAIGNGAKPRSLTDDGPYKPESPTNPNSNEDEYFGSGFCFPHNFHGTLERCYAEKNGRFGFWVTEGGTLIDCVGSESGYGKPASQFPYVRPADFFSLPSRTPYMGQNLRLIRCTSINSLGLGYWMDAATYIFLEDCKLLNPAGWNGYGSMFGSHNSHQFDNSRVSFKRVECKSSIVPILIDSSINCVFGPAVVVTDASKPVRVAGGRTSNLRFENWTTVSQTLPTGSGGGIVIEGGASTGAVTKSNVTVTRTDPNPEDGTVGPPPIDPGDPDDPIIPPVDPDDPVIADIAWIEGYAHRYIIQIPPANIDMTLLDVPVPIAFSDAVFAPLWAELGVYFPRLCITTADGTKLNGDVVSWDAPAEGQTVGKGLIYVRVPVVSHEENTYLVLYYDETAPYNSLITATGGAGAQEVWNIDGYLSVLHSAKVAGTTTVRDATPAARHAPVTGAVVWNYPQAGTGRLSIGFDKGEWLDTLITPAIFNATNTITVEMVLQLTNLDTAAWNEQILFGQHSPSTTRFYFGVYGMPPRWSMGVGDQMWGANNSLPCDENLVHVALSFNRATQTAYLYVNGTLVEAKSGYTFADLDKNLFAIWPHSWGGSELLKYASSCTLYELRVSTMARPAAFVKTVSFAERGLLYAVSTVEHLADVPEPPEPSGWHRPDMRFRRPLAINASSISTAGGEYITDCPVRIMFRTNVPESIQPYSIAVLGEMPYELLYNLAIYDEDGSVCSVGILHTPYDVVDGVRISEAIVRVPKLYTGRVNQLYIYYDPEPRPPTMAWWDGTKIDHELCYDPHFRVVLNYPMDSLDPNAYHDSVSNPTSRIIDKITINGIQNPPFRDPESYCGTGLRLGQGVSIPFSAAVGDMAKYHALTGAMTIELSFELSSYPVPPRSGEWRYCFPITKGVAFEQGGSWTVAIRDNGQGFFFIRKPDNSGWINNLDPFGPIPLNERVYIACVFEPNNHITVYTHIPSQGFRKYTSSAAGVASSFFSELLGGLNMAYGHGNFDGLIYNVAISDIARPENWIRMRGIAFTDSISSMILVHGKEEPPWSEFTATATAYLKNINTHVYTFLTTSRRTATADIAPITAEVISGRQFASSVVFAFIGEIDGAAYVDIYGASVGTAHVAPITGETEAEFYRGKILSAESFISFIASTARSFGIPYAPLPTGPEMYHPANVQVELRDSDGNLVHILENAYNISLGAELNTPGVLTLELPTNNEKTNSVNLGNEIWIRDRDTSEVIKKFILQRKIDVRG